MAMSISFYTCDPVKLHAYTCSVFKAMGCSDADAKLAADVLQSSDLRGIDSHGVARLSGYVRLWKAGRIKADAVGRVVRETPSTATYDGDSGLGLVMASNAMDIAIEKAKNCGSGWVAIKNSNHFGIAAYHAMKALDHDMIGMALTNASPLVAPTYSTERLLGTNPICFAIPAGQEQPVVIDLATSSAANGKLEIAQRAGKKVPLGWVQDEFGELSDDPSALKQGGSLIPLGSRDDLGSHKGYALSAFVDIFSGVLSGANYGPWVPPFVSFLPLAENMPGEGIGHFVGAWRVDGFREMKDFKVNMDQWIQRFKEAETVDGQDEVIIPGEPEYRAQQIREKEGIPLIDKVYSDLQGLASSFNLEFDIKT